MAVQVERLLVTLEANIGRYRTELAAAQSVTARQLTAIEGRFATMSGRLKSTTSSAALGIGATLGTIGAYLGVRQIKEYADSWLTVTRAIEGGEQVYGVRLRSAAALNKLANDSRVDNEAYAKLYARTAAAVRELGVSEEDVARATTTVAKALKLGTASASEQASTMLQLSQALQKGKLDGDEFRTVMENAGVIQELLADKLKVSKGEIVRMAAAGKLTVTELFEALVEGGDKVNRIFQQMPSTIEEGLTVLRNNVEQYIGELNAAYGGTDRLVAAIKSISDNIEPVADGVVTLGAALAVAFAPRIISAVAAMSVSLAVAAGPLGVIAGGLAAAGVAADLFGDKINFNIDLMRQATDQGADFGTALNHAFSSASVEGVTLQDTFRALVSVMIDETQKLIDLVSSTLPATLGVSVGDVTGTIRDLLNFMIGASVFAAKAVAATLTTVPQAVGEAVVDAINALIRGIQTMLDAVTDGVNKLIQGLNTVPGVEVGFLTAPDLGQIENNYTGAGEKAGKAFSDAAGALSKDWMAEAGAGFGRLLDDISAKAKDNALFRQFREGTTLNRETDKKPIFQTSAAPDKAALRARRAFERDLIQMENRIASEKAEADAVGRSAFETERLRIQQDLLNEARKAGVVLTDADKIKIEALSTAMAQAVVETDILRDAYNNLRNDSKDILKGFISDLRESKSASEALGNALNKIADKLIDMAVNDLVESALGGLTGKGGNATAFESGSAILKMFGFAKGGVAANGMPVNLPKFASGGVSKSAAIFGEAGPEAAVPLSGGRYIPVELRMPDVPKARASDGGSTQINFAPVIQLSNGTPEGVRAAQTDLLPQIKAMVDQQIVQKLTRSATVRKVVRS